MNKVKEKCTPSPAHYSPKTKLVLPKLIPGDTPMRFKAPRGSAVDEQMYLGSITPGASQYRPNYDFLLRAGSKANLRGTKASTHRLDQIK